MYGKSKRVEFHYYLEDFIAKKSPQYRRDRHWSVSFRINSVGRLRIIIYYLYRELGGSKWNID